jgi:hypothetical protein
MAPNGIDAGTLTFTFTSGGIDVDVYEKTFLLTHQGFGSEQGPSQ